MWTWVLRPAKKRENQMWVGPTGTTNAAVLQSTVVIAVNRCIFMRRFG